MSYVIALFSTFHLPDQFSLVFISIACSLGSVLLARGLWGPWIAAFFCDPEFSVDPGFVPGRLGTIVRAASLRLILVRPERTARTMDPRCSAGGAGNCDPCCRNFRSCRTRSKPASSQGVPEAYGLHCARRTNRVPLPPAILDRISRPALPISSSR